MEILIVVLITIAGCFLASKLIDKTEDNIETVVCDIHEWREWCDNDGLNCALVCIHCMKKAGNE